MKLFFIYNEKPILIGKKGGNISSMSRQSTYFNTCIGAQDQLSNVLTQNELLWSQFPIPHINLEKFQFTRKSLGQKNAPFPRIPINKYHQHILETKKHPWTVKICVFLKKHLESVWKKRIKYLTKPNSTQQKPQEKKRPHGHPVASRPPVFSPFFFLNVGNWLLAPQCRCLAIQKSKVQALYPGRTTKTTSQHVTTSHDSGERPIINTYLIFFMVAWIEKTWNLDCCRPLCFSFKLKTGKLHFCLTNHLWEGFHLKVTTNITGLCRCFVGDTVDGNQKSGKLTSWGW